MPEREMLFREAIAEAMREEMQRDSSVFLIGEDVGPSGGIFKCCEGLFEQFGPQRVLDAPIAEAGYIGLSVGAAMTQMRPIAELMFGDFALLAMDQIVNQAAKIRYMTGGQCKVPMTIRLAMGAGRSSAAQHSQSLQSIFAHVPGLKVAMPSTPRDAKGLLKSAIRDDNPVLFFEDKNVNDVISCKVISAEKKLGLKVQPIGCELDFIIKKSAISSNPADARPERWTSGETLDVAIAEKDLKKRKIILSIKLLETLEKAEALEKYGAESGSGRSLPFSGLADKILNKSKKEDNKE